MDWTLEDWLTDNGDRVVTRRAELGRGSLSLGEQLLYGVWLLDTEIRNGGVAQYFGNRGVEEWQNLLRTGANLPALSRFASQVEIVISGTADPYVAVVESAVDLNCAYYTVQEDIVKELRAAFENQVPW